MSSCRVWQGTKLLKRACLLTGRRVPVFQQHARCINASADSLSLLGETSADKIYAPEGRAKRACDNLPTYYLEEDFGPSHSERVKALPQVYSRATLLEELTEDDLGKWYECREQDLDQLPLCTQIANKDLFEATLTKHVMIRDESLSIIQGLEESEKELVARQEGGEEGASTTADSVTKDLAFGKSAAVHGPRGSGKSMALSLVHQYALQRDYLVIACRGEDFLRDLFGFITPSTTREGIYNQDRYAKEWCKAMLATHATKLRAIKLKRSYEYTWKSPVNGPEATGDSCENEGTTLHDLFTMSTLQTDLAAGIVYDIVEELVLTKPDEPRVMVLMDNVNLWDMDSKFRRPDCAYKKIPARKLSMIDAFSKFQTTGPGSGMSVFAITCGKHATLTMSRKHLAEANFAVGTSVYSDDEFVNCVSHFKTSSLISSDVDPFYLARMKGLTGNVPRDVMFDAALT